MARRTTGVQPVAPFQMSSVEPLAKLAVVPQFFAFFAVFALFIVRSKISAVPWLLATDN